MEINAFTTRRINEEIDTLKLPKTSLAENSGIAYPTLGRKLKGMSDWTITEVGMVAQALRIPASSLLPPALTGIAELAVAV